MSSIGRLKLTSQGVLVLVNYSDVGNVALLRGEPIFSLRVH